MPHISDFEDQANHSPFVNRGGSTPFVKHQRDQSANLILDSVQRRGVPAKNQGPLGGRAAQVTVFMDDQSQHFDTTYLDENEDDYSPQLSGINLIVWGRNQSGQLGIESSQQSVIKQPQLVPHLDRIFGRGFS